MKRTKHIILLALLVATSSSIFAQLLSDDEFTAKGAISFDEGTVIPNLKFRNLRSETFNLYDKIDKPTIIEFWYTTCKQCVAYKGVVKKFSGQYNVISIAVDEKPSTVRKYLANNDIYWDNVQDSQSFKGFYQKTKGIAQPTYVVVNADKEIVKVFDDGNIKAFGQFLSSYR